MHRCSFLMPVLVMLVAALFLPQLVGACPMCKDAYSDGTGTSVASSFNPSILFMIITTFTVFFGVAFRIWWSYHRRAAARRMPLN